MKVLVTGAAGQICSHLLFFIGSGMAFGDTPVDLVLYDIPAAEKAVHGVALELQDCSFPLLQSVTEAHSIGEAFTNADFVLMVGSRPRGPGMERADLLQSNAAIFKANGEALEKYAKPSTKVVVVGNPANTNCLICMKNAPSIPTENFHALSRLDHNRLASQVAEKLVREPSEFSHLCVWGNHSPTMVPDLTNCEIDGKKVEEVIDDQDWIYGTMVPRVQKRGAEIIEWCGKSSAASAAKAICDTVRSVYLGTKEGEWVSMSVYTKGNKYGIDEDLFFSFPVVVKDGKIEVVEGLKWNEKIKAGVKITEDELIMERGLAGY